MKKEHVVLYISVFIVMTGYGLTLTVLPFYVERMALTAGADIKQASIHVGLLTGTFALMQFFFAPFWGALSDRIGRRPLIFIGLGGNAVFNIMFGLGSGLVTLYLARILGGIFSAAILPTANVYVIDASTDSDRGKSISRLNASIALGILAGPALGAWLSSRNWHASFRIGHVGVDTFSTPFLVAALLGFLALVASVFMLPESLRTKHIEKIGSGRKSGPLNHMWTPEVKKLLGSRPLWTLLVLSFITWFSLALFEGTFALHGKQIMQFGPARMGMVFIVCGAVMAVVQGTISGWILDRKGEPLRIVATGFTLVAIALSVLMLTRSIATILLSVGVLAFGMALLIPTLAVMVSRHSDQQQGTALGVQTAVNSLGQFAGPALGGLLFTFSIHTPYLATALLLFAFAISIIVKTVLINSRR